MCLFTPESLFVGLDGVCGAEWFCALDRVVCGAAGRMGDGR